MTTRPPTLLDPRSFQPATPFVCAAVATLAFLLAAPRAHAQQPNNTCGDNQAAHTIPGTGGTVQGDFFASSLDFGSGGGCGTDDEDVYYYFTPSVTASYRFSTCSSSNNIDTVLSIHTGCPARPNNLAGVNGTSCNDGGGCGNRSQFDSGTLTAGSLVVIRVGHDDQVFVGDTFTLVVSIAPRGACCDGSSAQCTLVATGECPHIGGYRGDGTVCFPNPCPLPGACCIPSPGQCTLVVSGTCGNPAWYQGDGTVCTPNPCPQQGACCNPTSGECAIVPSGTCGFGGGYQGDGTVCVPYPCPAPVNDICATAITVNVGQPAATGNNSSAGTDPSEVFGCISFGGQRGVWFDFTADADGGAYQFDTQGSSQSDTALAAYTACNGTSIGCDDDSGDIPPLSSRMTIILGASQNIKILVGTFGNVTPGGFVLNIAEVGLGACCNNGTGNCVITPSNSCTFTYRGNASVCEDVPCGTGACCNGETCTITTGAGCVALGGVFHGHATVCGAFFAVGSNQASYAAIGADPAAVPLSVGDCDDCAQVVALPFAFSYLDALFAQIGVTSNGYIEFGGVSSSLANVAIPNTNQPNNIVAALWDDLYPGTGGDVFTLTQGDTPNQTFTISWENVPQFSNTDSNSFQIILHEGGLIELRYGLITAEAVAGDYTIGFEDTGGVNGVNIPGGDLGSGNIAFNLNPISLSNPCAPPTGACCCGSSCGITTADNCTGANRAFTAGGICTPFSATSPCCRGNYNKSASSPSAPGGISVQDIFDFLASYFSNDPCANTNDSTGPNNGISVQDIFDFLAAYFGGC